MCFHCCNVLVVEGRQASRQAGRQMCSKMLLDCIVIISYCSILGSMVLLIGLSEDDRLQFKYLTALVEISSNNYSTTRK